MAKDSDSINLNTLPKLNILLELSYLKDYVNTLSGFEKKINRVKGDPETRNVFKVLKERNILVPAKKKYPYQLYKLDIKLLCKLVEHQPFIKKIYEYIDYLH